MNMKSIAAKTAGALALVALALPVVANADYYAGYGPYSGSFCPSPYDNSYSCPSGNGGIFGTGGWFGYNGAPQQQQYYPQYQQPTYYQPQQQYYAQPSYNPYQYQQPQQSYYPSYSNPYNFTYSPSYSYGYSNMPQYGGGVYFYR